MNTKTNHPVPVSFDVCPEVGYTWERGCYRYTVVEVPQTVGTGPVTVIAHAVYIGK
jgi:hypothetical protein